MNFDFREVTQDCYVCKKPIEEVMFSSNDKGEAHIDCLPNLKAELDNLDKLLAEQADEQEDW